VVALHPPLLHLPPLRAEDAVLHLPVVHQAILMDAIMV
jgi:hypothetical protein